jgi:hypothetical protein
MNHFNSPIIQTNQVAQRYTPQLNDDGDNQDDNDSKPKASDYKCFLAEDLQKIRRSSHHNNNSSHARHEIMDVDDEHDDFIKGLMYPRLEESDSNLEFFDDFYEEEMPLADTTAPPSSSTTASYPNSSNNNSSYNPPQRFQNSQSNIRAAYFAPMSDRYDFTSEKLMR